MVNFAHVTPKYFSNAFGPFLCACTRTSGVEKFQTCIYGSIHGNAIKSRPIHIHFPIVLALSAHTFAQATDPLDIGTRTECPLTYDRPWAYQTLSTNIFFSYNGNSTRGKIDPNFGSIFNSLKTRLSGRNFHRAANFNLRARNSNQNEAEI